MPFILAIEVDSGALRADSPFKNNNKPPRLSTASRYLSKPAVFSPPISVLVNIFKFFKSFFFQKWVCSTLFLRDTPQLLHLRAFFLVKLLSVRTKMAKLWVFAYYSSEERIATIDLKNCLLKPPLNET